MPIKIVVNDIAVMTPTWEEFQEAGSVSDKFAASVEPGARAEERKVKNVMKQLEALSSLLCFFVFGREALHPNPT